MRGDIRRLLMTNVNVGKRAAHGRRVCAAVHEILNDPAVMPNADCPDLLVSVSRVAFGKTLAEIYLDVHARWRRPASFGAEAPHDKYMREARERGKDTYIDFDEVFYFPQITEVVSRELQRRLGLPYTPVLRRLSDLSGGNW